MAIATRSGTPAPRGCGHQFVESREREVRGVCSGTRWFPRLIETADRLVAANENKLGIRVFLSLNFQHVAELTEEWDRARLLVFRLACVEPNLPAFEINTVPTNFKNLATAHSCVVAHGSHWTQIFRNLLP